jgi:hypothetical protein
MAPGMMTISIGHMSDLRENRASIPRFVCEQFSSSQYCLFCEGRQTERSSKGRSKSKQPQKMIAYQTPKQTLELHWQSS